MEMGKAAAVVLAVNGKRYEAAGVDPSTTLLEFLRTHTPVRGPKLGCGEGKYVARPSGRHTSAFAFAFAFAFVDSQLEKESSSSS
jgi:hypothetical protein